MSTATAFAESETNVPEIPPGHHHAPDSTPRERTAPKHESWQEAVLHLLAQGASVTDAMRHVGFSSAAFYKSCARHPEFRTAAARVRNAYRIQVAEEFHDSEACARMLVDSVMHGEQLPASLRLRAALSILNRQGDHWLPVSIPAPENNVDTEDIMDTTNVMDLIGSMDIVDTLDAVGPVNGVDTVDTTDDVDPIDTRNTVDTMYTMGNLADLACRQILAEKNKRWNPQSIPRCAARDQPNPPSLPQHPGTPWTL